MKRRVFISSLFALLPAAAVQLERTPFGGRLPRRVEKMGNSLKPPAPRAITGTRDADGNLLIEWTPSRRLGSGLTPNTGTALREEREEYALEILDAGGASVVNTYQVTDFTRAAILRQPAEYTPGLSNIVGNNVLPSTVGFNSWAVTEQKLAESDDPRGAALEGAMYSSGPSYLHARMFLVHAANADLSLTIADVAAEYGLDFSFDPFAADGEKGKLTVYERGVSIFTAYTIGDVGRTSARIVLAEGLAHYFKGDERAPFFTSAIAVLGAYVYRGRLMVDPEAGVENVRVAGPRPSFYYSADMQTEDFGSIQPSVRVKVYGISAFVGRGAPGSATV